MRATKTFARHKGLLACVLLSAGLFLGACVLLAFYSVDPKPVDDAIRHLFGISTDDDEFVLPMRERTKWTEKPEAPAEPGTPPAWFESVGVKHHSAILVSGSRGYDNYRHQADICHAFQILKARGLHEDNIITFLADDIAHNSRNPYPGKIFNRPGGEDVYAGCAKDYRGRDVNVQTLLAVLRGDRKAVAKKGSGKVLKNDPMQKVFFYYSDHGSVGTIAMPYGPPLYADQLQEALSFLVRNNHFDQMLIYLEACESGSMFRGKSFNYQDRVLAVTASNAYESSYATYCPDYSSYRTRYIVPNATYIGSCLGDLFSVAWMEHTEELDPSEVLVEEQVKHVRDRTSDEGLFIYGSHVMTYGDSKGQISRQVVGNFLSYFLAPTGMTRARMEMKLAEKEKHDAESVEQKNAVPQSSLDFTVDQRSADLLYLYRQAMDNDEEAERELEAELSSRRYIDASIRAVVGDLIEQGHLASDVTVEEYVSTEVNPRPQEEVVKDWECLRGAVAAWEETCAPMTTYAWKYAIAFANLCNEGVQMSAMKGAFSKNCEIQMAT